MLHQGGFRTCTSPPPILRIRRNNVKSQSEWMAQDWVIGHQALRTSARQNSLLSRSQSHRRILRRIERLLDARISARHGFSQHPCQTPCPRVYRLPVYSIDSIDTRVFLPSQSRQQRFHQEKLSDYEEDSKQGFDMFLAWCVDVVGTRKQREGGHFRHSGITAEDLRRVFLSGCGILYLGSTT
jgi:hypothetical protein